MKTIDIDFTLKRGRVIATASQRDGLMWPYSGPTTDAGTPLEAVFAALAGFLQREREDGYR